MKKSLLLLPSLALLALAGCNGQPQATAAEEQGFKHPSKTPPAGFTTAPPATPPTTPPATGG